MFVEEKRQGEVQVPTIEPWRKVLLDAADLIEREGWWNGSQLQRERVRAEGKEIYCAVTAMSAMETIPLGTAYSKLALAVAREGGWSIPEWNDRSTKEIVVATMRRVALEGR